MCRFFITVLRFIVLLVRYLDNQHNTFYNFISVIFLFYFENIYEQPDDFSKILLLNELNRASHN